MADGLTLEQLRANSNPHAFPRHLLVGCETALVLFAAAFHGRQDAVWMAAAGLTTTCVDTDLEKLHEMQAMYPDNWVYAHDDVFAFGSRAAADGNTWDVVSLDPFTNQMQECANLLPLWCHLANRAVLLGVLGDTEIVAPNGWRIVEQLPRSAFAGGVFWVVLEPC